MATASNNTVAESSRYTKDGRKISYHLSVIQQPERARACGQGPKSSSDRRPVDPPPIIELHVFEGEQNQDITFPYNASFFLFATLESARSISQGRVPQTQTNQPVLTGTPVSGVAYLDRPTPAGYFIFPDLSVRHEGQYRLTFTLFEELKEPRDADQDATTDNVATLVYRRCEVKSKPFQVYSAKKFPGLTESTLLSRVVADQGCRVRIRRDVRMRRRDSKHEKDWDKPDEEQATEGTRMNMPHSSYEAKALTSPEQPSEPPEKAESAPSSSSTQTIAAPPTNQSMSQQAPGPYAAYPTWYQHPNTGQQTTQPQVYTQQTAPEQAYQQQYQQQYSPTQTQNISQFPQYSNSYAFQQSSPGQMVQSPTYGYVTQQQMQPVYAHQPQDMTQVNNMRQQPAVYGSYYSSNDRDPQPQPQYGSQQAVAYQQPVDPTGTQAPPSNVPLAIGKPLPPLEVPRVSHTTAETLTSPVHATAVSRSSGAMGPSSMMRPPPPQYVTQAGTGVGTKRSYGAAFSTQHTDEPMRNGTRPNADHVPEWSDQSGEEDYQDLEYIRMSYRRADGSYTTVSPRRFSMA